MWKSALRIAYVCLFLCCGAVLLMVIQPGVKADINEMVMTWLPYFAFIMYLINRGTGFTQALFMNCDHSLLTYSFYKRPGDVYKRQEEEQSESGQPQKLRMPGRRRQRVVSIDAERTVETDTDRLRNDLLDLVESLKSKKILTGTIQGVERLADNPEMSYAVIYHGDFKVIIPVLEAIEEPRCV